MLKFLSQFSAWRWAVYLVLLPLMVADQVCTAIRLGFDLWCALVQQHEAAFRRPAKTMPQMTPPLEQASRDLVAVTNALMQKKKKTA